ncbi:putative universal stress protein [Rhizobium freirei PRF 81]|uniref:Universal stress protein n=1 Tax=Rhizobium freirei PRF 81 TaxID=363754 RepID=N6U4L1_9HYPH|nr:universal stress protein [Rhizobium freirei]ENN85263.1 putative universal stress protein [Rhizobium freirei PRF 81]
MFRHILVPTDGSKMASQAAARAMALAAEMNAEVTLLAVAEPFRMLAIDSDEYRNQQQEHEKSAASNCKAMLSRQKLRASDKGVLCKTLVIKSNDIAKTIVDTADSLDCDLIAMATHGRSGLSSLLMGSVAASVIAKAHIPVLVYR